jgi:hypothetical protein
MVSSIVLVAAVATLFLIWRHGYWPFDGRYGFLAKYGEGYQSKASPAETKPGA